VLENVSSLSIHNNPRSIGTISLLFKALVPAFLYKKVLKRIASHGFVVIAPWRLSILTDFQDPTIRAKQNIKVIFLCIILLSDKSVCASIVSS
jgi:hypothetical protein